MASEQKRGCGFRIVGKLYLCGEFINVPCDRLPLELKSCPVCGAGIHFTRSTTEINPHKLFGNHDVKCIDCGYGYAYSPDVGATDFACQHPDNKDGLGVCPLEQCGDKFRPCLVCDPSDAPAYIMTVGKKYYTPQSFIQEAMKLGVSKRIAQIPKHLKLGKTIVYLAHPEAVSGFKPPSAQGELIGNGQARLLDADKTEKRLGIFCAFIPQRVEMPVYKSKLTDKKRKELEKRGITPIPIADNDPDHSPKQKRAKRR